MKQATKVGDQYGNLTVLSAHSKTRNGHIRFTCRCICNNICNVLGTHLRQGNTTSCGCTTKINGPYSKHWTGYGDISGDFWGSHIVRSANGDKGRRNAIPLTITIKDAWEQFLKQEGKCAYTKLPLLFPKHGKDKAYTASLDRIDSSKGYELGNIQWVHKDINIMKNKFTNEHFIAMCNLVAGGACEVTF